ncbi:hypothetical protein BDL97_01G022500 [Sphagnum fallax]|nr:hypothetical protein BDL97_01G022500 [Sphagnum fallax]KAH8973010.1 hypothetical protein BDL97_01G022500 [Sphagnum fallax]
MSVLIPFSIELLSKSTFEAPNFILVFGLTYRSRSIRSGAVERIFLAHLVWFGFIFLCFCFWFGDLWFCGCGEDAPEGRKLILQREGRKMAAVTASLCVSPQLTTVRRPGSGPTCSSCSSSAHSSPPAAARVNCTSTPFLASSGVHASQSSLMFSEGRQMLAATPRQFQRQERGNFVVRGLFGLGVPELVVIAGVAALIFGPKKLPEIGKSLGKTVKSFSQAAQEFQSEIKTSTEAQAEVKSNTATPLEEPKVAPPATTISNSTSTSEKDSP